MRILFPQEEFPTFTRHREGHGFALMLLIRGIFKNRCPLSKGSAASGFQHVALTGHQSRRQGFCP